MVTKILKSKKRGPTANRHGRVGAMAPDFWESGTLGTIKKFLPEDKSEVGFSRAKFENAKLQDCLENYHKILQKTMFFWMINSCIFRKKLKIWYEKLND